MRMDPFQETCGVKLTPGLMSASFHVCLVIADCISMGTTWQKNTLLRSSNFSRFSYIAICCLSLLHQLDKIDVEKAVNYIVRCKNLDGGFGATPGGESHAGQSMYFGIHWLDKRLSSCWMPCLGWFSALPGIVYQIVRNQHCFDPSSLAVFCCVGALAITGSLHHVDKDLLGWWLCERQVKSGGLNGRPEKLPDVRHLSKISPFAF